MLSPFRKTSFFLFCQSSSSDVNDNIRDGRPSTVLHTSRKLHEAVNVLNGLYEEESDSDISEDDVAKSRRQDEFQPVKGKPGMFYKVSLWWWSLVVVTMPWRLGCSVL